MFIILFSTTVLETNTIRWYLASRLKNSWEEESARRNSEYGYARGVYLDSSILFSDSTLLCLANKRLVDHTTSLGTEKLSMKLEKQISERTFFSLLGASSTFESSSRGHAFKYSSRAEQLVRSSWCQDFCRSENLYSQTFFHQPSLVQNKHQVIAHYCVQPWFGKIRNDTRSKVIIQEAQRVNNLWAMVRTVQPANASWSRLVRKFIFMKSCFQFLFEPVSFINNFNNHHRFDCGQSMLAGNM